MSLRAAVTEILASSLGLLMVPACTPPLTAYRTDLPALQLRVLGQPGFHDGRARFREVLCGIRPQDCDSLLVALADDPAVRPHPPPMPRHDTKLRILFVPGAFQECFQKVAVPYEAGIAHLRAIGYRVSLVPVSGRSSSEHNAAQIAQAVREEQLASGEKLVLMGYSKGTPDILQFLIGYPDLAARVDAVVSIAGAVNGTPVADKNAALYALVSRIDFAPCAAGDGGVVHSLRRDVRMPWLSAHRLPEHIRYFSLGAFSRAEETGRFLAFTQRDLVRMSALNDGQTIFFDQILPGSTLLGYANGDHWAIVLPLQDKWTYWAANPAGVHYPRHALLEAIVLCLAEALGGGSTAAASE